MRLVLEISQPQQPRLLFRQTDDRRVQALGLTLQRQQVFRRGIALVPQGRELFPEMTVAENLELGALARTPKAEIPGLLAEVFERFPRLRERSGQRAGTLSGGGQQMPARLTAENPTTRVRLVIDRWIFKDGAPAGR